MTPVYITLLEAKEVYGYWLSPNSRFYQVDYEDHYDTGIDILKIPREETDVYGGKINVYNKLFEQGYIRIIGNDNSAEINVQFTTKNVPKKALMTLLRFIGRNKNLEEIYRDDTDGIITKQRFMNWLRTVIEKRD